MALKSCNRWFLKTHFVSRERKRIIVNLNARANYARMCVSVQCMQIRNWLYARCEPSSLQFLFNISFWYFETFWLVFCLRRRSFNFVTWNHTRSNYISWLSFLLLLITYLFFKMVTNAHYPKPLNCFCGIRLISKGKTSLTGARWYSKNWTNNIVLYRKALPTFWRSCTF